MTAPTELQELRTLLAEIADLRGIEALLYWDQATYLPPKAGDGRSSQLATMAAAIHEKQTSPTLGRLLDKLAPYADQLPPDDDVRAVIDVAHYDFDRATRIPGPFMAELAAHTGQTYVIWAKARPANDFAAVQPYLEKTLDLSRRYAEFFPGYAHIADPLIDSADRGMTVADIQPVFAELEAELVPLVQAIVERDGPDDAILGKYYPEAGQWAFSLEVLAQLGYDFDRGRQDKTHHPFMIRLGHDDNRVTTRVDEHRLDGLLYSSVHECGHALYEMGTADTWRGTPVDSGTSSGIHESQSRLWENLVGRSRGFWEHFLPTLQGHFPEQLAGVDVDTIYGAVNTVRRSLIRTESDEVTYNLHVLIRFGLELDLLEGRLAVADLPAAWHERYQASLGVHAPSDVDGVLQDVHWYGGLIGGAFQGYTLGTIMASQFYAAALAAHPEIPDQIRAGQFDTLHTWLRTNIYAPGRKYTANELLQRVTGGGLDLAPYLAYLRRKFGALYGVAV